MSLLSDTNHSPQRIYSLLRLLHAQGGELAFENIKTWFKPIVRGVEQRGSEGEHVNIRQMLGAATSLGMIETTAQNRYRLCAPAPETLAGFADAVHDHLAHVAWDHPDSIVLEAFAATVAVTEIEQGTAWLEGHAKDLAARINAAVRSDTDQSEDESNRRFNSTKASAWKRWMIFLGLGIPMRKVDFYPYPVQRLAYEVARARVEPRATGKLEISAFMTLIAERLPYLDGGRLFEASRERTRLPALERRVSRVLSGALRDLHDDQRLKLETVGDAKESYALTNEPHAVRNVKAVDFASEPGNG